MPIGFRYGRNDLPQPKGTAMDLENAHRQAITLANQWKRGIITESELTEQMLLVLSMFQYELSKGEVA